MINASDLLASRAEAFRIGRFAEVSECIEFPMPLFANGDVKVLNSGDQVEAELSQHRDALRRSGYHNSSFEVLSIVSNDDKHARFDVRWTNTTRQGHVISWLEVSYFVSRRSSGGWVISMIEVLDEQKAYLMAV